MIDPRVRVMVAALAVATVFTGCSGETPDDQQASTGLYCDLISTESIEPVLDVHDIEAEDVVDHGGPHGTPGTRAFECLIGAEGAPPVVSVTVTEGLGEDDLARERTRIEQVAAEHRDENGSFLSTVDEDGAFGYVRYVPEKPDSAAPARVAGGLVVADRLLSVMIRTDEEHAGQFSPLALEVAQEGAANLDRWDAEHAE